VKAKEKTTGKEQSIRIEGSTGLSKEDIEKMKKDAEANARKTRSAKSSSRRAISPSSTLLGYVALFFAAACFFLSADIASKMTPPGSVPLQWGAVALFLAGAILLRLSRELKERTPRLIHEIARSRLFRIVHLTAATIVGITAFWKGLAAAEGGQVVLGGGILIVAFVVILCTIVLVTGHYRLYPRRN
jgi:hypothetical protein